MYLFVCDQRSPYLEGLSTLLALVWHMPSVIMFAFHVRVQTFLQVKWFLALLAGKPFVLVGDFVSV